MAKKRTFILPVLVELACDECGGDMYPVDDPVEGDIYGLEFMHRCSSCGAIQSSDQRYPHIAFEGCDIKIY